MDLKYVPPNDPARSTSAGVTFGRNSSQSLKKISPFFFRTGADALSLSTSTAVSGILGGSLYRSFFCRTSLARYSPTVRGSPVPDDPPSSPALFPSSSPSPSPRPVEFCPSAAAFFHALSISPPHFATSAQDALPSKPTDPSARRYRLPDFMAALSTFPIPDSAKTATVILLFPFAPTERVPIARIISSVRAGSGGPSSLSSVRDISSDRSEESTFSSRTKELMADAA
eukprot:CAMPEP_0194329430 /NCGR_PEP_ID=MMETSP0171-20130528/48263_1 /TAXON_ID=218684 /ORGANISM="Corethron pennatum, Strain L29A3" /LENGTH=227 /DNA_ID=CAMNT_0039090169 /DNA_START=571 /DNA_END=1250 /DNA_ORIENTATION=+